MGFIILKKDEEINFISKLGMLKTRKIIFIPKSIGETLDASCNYRVTISRMINPAIVQNSKTQATKTDQKKLKQDLPSGEKKTLIAMGQSIFTKNPNQYHMVGIGSCLGIYLYDLSHENFAMAHCSFPNHQYNRDSPFKGVLPALYVDVSIISMINTLCDNGSRKRLIKCKLVGGSNIINDKLKIGQLNIEMAKKILHDEKIELIAEDVGGNVGRAILSFQKDGQILLRKDLEKIFL
jgi:chemotaxis protein CheD